MNILLVHANEVAADGMVVLRDRRAAHLRDVLHAAPGQVLRAGMLDGPRGQAIVTATDADSVTVTVQCQDTMPPPRDVLLLAVPRPKVLLRMVEHAAALGFGRLVLFRSWRVEKSHLGSTALAPATLAEHLQLGLEQAGRTHLPRVTFCPLFKPMVEDTLPTLELPMQRFVAHPTAATATVDLAPRGAFALALGPDGGFLPYEVDALAAQGFLPITCGPHALRTETALAVLTGQLHVLRQQRHGGESHGVAGQPRDDR